MPDLEGRRGGTGTRPAGLLVVLVSGTLTEADEGDTIALGVMVEVAMVFVVDRLEVEVVELYQEEVEVDIVVILRASVEEVLIEEEEVATFGKGVDEVFVEEVVEEDEKVCALLDVVAMGAACRRATVAVELMTIAEDVDAVDWIAVVLGAAVARSCQHA